MATKATRTVPAKAQGDAPLTTRQVADKLGTDPRTLRKFLRSRDEGVGAGKRYSFEAKELPALRKAFTAWAKAEETDDEATRAEARLSREDR